MADPITMMAASSVASLAGGVTGAFGAEAKGASESAMYNYQAGVARLNATIDKQNADYTRTAGETAAYQSGLKTADIVGRQTVAQGASGVDVNTGSAKAVRDTTTALGQLDQNLIRTNYAKKAYGYEVESATKTAEAGADVIAGTEARRAADISAVSSILGSVSSVAGKWYGASPSVSKLSDSMMGNPTQLGSLY